MDITADEYFELSRDLEKHHALFYKMWEMGKPIFDSNIKTAGVSFNEAGEYFQFVFNPEFWDRMTPYERTFVICHECLHVILNHGIRINGNKEPDRCNQALDVVVNHSLVNNFGFNRSLIRDADEYCWVDTVFPNQAVPDDECFEYYFHRIKPMDAAHLQLVDTHGSLGQTGLPGLPGMPSEVIDKLNEALGETEKGGGGLKEVVEKHFEKDFAKNYGGPAGTGQGGIWTFANVGKVQKKKKWETVIKQWAKKYDKPEFHDVEQWARTNRRFTMMNGGLILPTEMELEHDLEGRIQVWFFQDTSGSCSGFTDRFFAAAMSLPEDRFDVKMHCFDTEVYETDLKSKKLYGFGGTSFQCIERYVQNYIKKEGQKYPKAVFVITDGYGDNVNPEIPRNWYWFLSNDYRHCIPKESNVFQLKNFE
jgi:hypothetical protein